MITLHFHAHILVFNLSNLPPSFETARDSQKSTIALQPILNTSCELQC